MLRQAKEFKSFKLRARDGDIGKAMEFYFDDEYWTVRYLVADTGGWLYGRQVLISPYALHPANETDKVLPVDLTKQQIENSPSLAADLPVDRQYEMQYYTYYGWPNYWGGPEIWGSSTYPSPLIGGVSWPGGVGVTPVAATPGYHRREGDPHLRSSREMTDYHLQALDGEIGHVIDFVVDEQTWVIRYLVVATKNWWPGKHVLVAPQWIERVSWSESKVFVNLSRDMIKESPEYQPESLNRDYEASLYRHYGREQYWVDEVAARHH